MRAYLVALAWCAAAVPASANTSLPQMILDASICSDASLQNDASCDPPAQVAAVAVAKCQSAWNAIADKAIGPLPANASPADHIKAVARYKESIEVEYTRLAELKTLGLRTAAGKCGFE